MNEDLLRHYPLDLDRLPRGWVWAFVGEVIADIQPGFPSGKHNSEGVGIPHLRPMNIDRVGRIDLAEVKYVPARDGVRLRAGDVIFNNTNSPVLIGKTASFDLPGEWAFSNHMTRLRPPQGVSQRFVAYQLHFLWMTGYFRHRCTHHVNQASIASGTLARTVPIVLAPELEQRRIVAVIEELFSRIDAGIEALQRARRNLQRMRAAILQSAVMGRLVVQDSDAEHAEILVRRLLDEHPEARNHAFKFDTRSLPKLPSGWAWLAVGQLGEVVTGRTPDTRRGEYFGPGLPFVTPGDLGEEMILWGAARELTEAGATATRRLPANSVLVTCIGATIGKVGLAGVPCTTNQQINALIPFESYAIPRWVLHAMASPWFFGLLRSQASSTTMPILNKSRFQALPMPLPPFAEQVRIVAEVERHISLLENLKVAVENTIRRAAQMRRSILGSAFAGRLIPQDRADEPASNLMARVNAARVAKESRHVRSSRRPRR